VELSFDIESSPSLGPRQRARLLERYGTSVVVIAADERSQLRNRQLALARLAAKLAEGLKLAPTRRPTRPTRASVQRRLDDKKSRSSIKRGRRPPRDLGES
jgi:ribosome-associated protein